MAEKNEINKLSFEQAVKSLTDIVSNIESGQTPLQESLDQYAEGVKLIKHCREILKQAEEKIETIEQAQEKDDKANSDSEDLF